MARAERRAPRLDARTYLAPYLTRRGRFLRVDPLRGRPLPSLPRFLGALGWAALLAESVRRAWKAQGGLARSGSASDEDEPAEDPAGA